MGYTAHCGGGALFSSCNVEISCDHFGGFFRSFTKVIVGFLAFDFLMSFGPLLKWQDICS